MTKKEALILDKIEDYDIMKIVWESDKKVTVVYESLNIKYIININKHGIPDIKTIASIPYDIIVGRIINNVVCATKSMKIYTLTYNELSDKLKIMFLNIFIDYSNKQLNILMRLLDNALYIAINNKKSHEYNIK